MIICPYCGDPQPLGDHCRSCGGRFEPLSRRASLNAMGPWFIRDERRPFLPGLSYETIAQMVEADEITTRTIMRAPSTKQLWTVAKRVPGVAHLLGYCHRCGTSVDPNDSHCPQCSAVFGAYLDRNYLGLPDVKPLPFEADVLSSDPGARATGPAVDWHGTEPPDERLSAFGTDEELTAPEAMLEPLEQSEVQPQRSPRSTQTSSSSRQRAAAKREPMPDDARGDRSAHAEATAPPTPTQKATATAPTSHSSQETDPTVAPTHAEAERAWRTMQRQVARQDRMIRWLVVLMIVVLIASALLIVVVIQSTGSTRATGSDTPASTTRTDTHDAAESTLPGGEDSTSSEANPSPDPADSASTGSGADASGYHAELQRALGLLRRARIETHSIASRIADYQQAIAVLTNVRNHMPGDQQPDDLAERIQTAQRELNALRNNDSPNQ